MLNLEKTKGLLPVYTTLNSWMVQRAHHFKDDFLKSKSVRYSKKQITKMSTTKNALDPNQRDIQLLREEIMSFQKQSIQELEVEEELRTLERNYATLHSELKASKSPDILKGLGKMPSKESLETLPSIH
jgi:hypothetical protein